MSAIPDIAENAFGAELPDIRSLVQNDYLNRLFLETLTGILEHYLDSTYEPGDLAAEILELAVSIPHCETYEVRAYELLKNAGAFEQIPARLSARSQKIAREISRHLEAGERVLDIGCGEGSVGKFLSQNGADITLCDVYEHAKISSHGVPFVLHREGKPLPFSEETFDAALLLTVLHHSDNPRRLIDEARRVLRIGGRLIVIESVFGINPADAPELNRETKRFVKLDSETQRLSTVFFDHFSNRIVRFHPDPARKVNVPFNFNTPENWRMLFKQAGLLEKEVFHQGVDHPYMPVYHTLHICERRS